MEGKSFEELLEEAEQFCKEAELRAMEMSDKITELELDQAMRELPVGHA